MQLMEGQMSRGNTGEMLGLGVGEGRGGGGLGAGEQPQVCMAVEGVGVVGRVLLATGQRF